MAGGMMLSGTIGVFANMDKPWFTPIAIGIFAIGLGLWLKQPWARWTSIAIIALGFIFAPRVLSQQGVGIRFIFYIGLLGYFGYSLFAWPYSKVAQPDRLPENERPQSTDD
jgi:hypothetical protein